jgi:hypothetical protein
MGDEFKGVQYALFPKKIKYKRSKDGSNDNKWNYDSSNQNFWHYCR